MWFCLGVTSVFKLRSFKATWVCVFSAEVKSNRRALYPPRECAPSVGGRQCLLLAPEEVAPKWKNAPSLVLGALLPHGWCWRVHAQGNDNALAVFSLDPLYLRLLRLVTILALCGQGGRCRCVRGQHVQRTRHCCKKTASQTCTLRQSLILLGPQAPTGSRHCPDGQFLCVMWHGQAPGAETLQ